MASEGRQEPSRERVRGIVGAEVDMGVDRPAAGGMVPGSSWTAG